MTALVIRSAPWTIFESAAERAAVRPPWDLLEHPASLRQATEHPHVAEVHRYGSHGSFRAWTPAGIAAILRLRRTKYWDRVYILAAYDDDARSGARLLAYGIGGARAEILFPDGRTKPVAPFGAALREIIRLVVLLPTCLFAGSIGLLAVAGVALQHFLFLPHPSRTSPPRIPRIAPRIPETDISIIIVAWNAADDIGPCLDSLAPGPVRSNCDVIVVDNASTDETGAIAQSRSFVKVIHASTNRGYGAGFNAGLEAARGRYIAVANSDIVVHPESVDHIVAYLDAHPDVGAVAPRMLDPHGRPQVGFQTRAFPSVAGISAERTFWRRFLPESARKRYTMENAAMENPTDVDQPAGTFIVARREIFETVGGMDESFFILFEDVDWCRRIKNAGWRIVHLPSASLIHGKSHSLVKRGPRLTIDFERSMSRYFSLHHDVLDRFLLGSAFILDAAAGLATSCAEAMSGSVGARRAIGHHLARIALHAGITR
jgi:GT2 family glycosyltransferase